MESKIKHRVIALLERKELEFLDKLGKDALFSTGHKLSYNQIIKGLVELAMEIGLSGENVRSTEDLKKNFLNTLLKKGVKNENSS